MSAPYVDPIATGWAVDPRAGLPAAGVEATSGPDGFARWVVQGLSRVNAEVLDAQVEVQRLAAGEPVELHRLMLRLEESRMSFQLMMQVRNRLLEAYQDVMRMQV